MNEKNMYYIEEQNDYQIDLYTNQNCDETICDLFHFFQYKTMKSSKLFEGINESLYDNLYDEMIATWKNNKKINECIIEEPKDKTNNKLFDRYGLLNNEINLKCKKIVMLYDKRKDKENNHYYPYLTIMRHIRNSIAHGCAYVNHHKRKKIFLFADYNKKENLTAKIICTQTDLNRWKVLIKKYISMSKKVK